MKHRNFTPNQTSPQSRSAQERTVSRKNSEPRLYKKTNKNHLIYLKINNLRNKNPGRFNHFRQNTHTHTSTHVRVHIHHAPRDASRIYNTA